MSYPFNNILLFIIPKLLTNNNYLTIMIVNKCVSL